MNKKRERYEELYGKYRNNELSLEEFGEFIRLLSEDESAEDGWWEDQAREDWQGSADILRKIRAAEQTRNQKIRIRRWIGWSVAAVDRKSTRLNSSHVAISYAVFCLKKKNQ